MSTVEENKSRFGYHPCSYDVYLQLKYIHKNYWQALKDFANWQRWDRKLPQNRIVRKYKRDDQNRRIGYEVVGPRQEPKYCQYFVEKVKDRWGYTSYKIDDLGVLELYRQAKYPSEKPVQQFSENKLREIQIIYNRLRDYNNG